MSKGILIYAEITRENYLHTVTFELANKAMELRKNLSDCPVMALVLLPSGLIDEFKEVFRVNGFDKVFYVSDDRFKQYSTDIFAPVAIKCVRDIDPEIMLIGATNQGRDLAPRISSALGTGLTADCTGLEIVDGRKLAATRPTFGGQLMATILSKKLPQMATVRPKVFKPMKEFVNADTNFIRMGYDFGSYTQKVEILGFSEKIRSEVNDLDCAEIIVAGGRGMQSAEGFELLKKLADKIGGTIGASRLAVEMGLADKNCQIGQTGKTVNPKLYVACGISGALQHTVGMSNSDKIIAINKDKNAPIFEIADYAMVGDAFEIIPELLKFLG